MGAATHFTPERDWPTLARELRLDPETPLVVGLSGGADSVYLARLLARGASRPPLTLVHVNHALRGADSGRDEDFCRELAAELELDLVTERAAVDARSSDLERRLREARYRVRAGVARDRGAPLVATAHHLDDALETLLLRWLRGTSLEGLAGLRPLAPLPLPSEERGDLRVVRPLLRLRAAEIREALRAGGHPWREDGTNATPRFTRNRVRHGLLPLLRGRLGPDGEEQLFAFLRAADAYRERLAASSSLELRPAAGSRGRPLWRLARAPLVALPPAAQRQALWRAIVQKSGRAPGAAALERIQLALRAGDRGRWTLRGAWDLALTDESLELTPPEALPAGDFIPGTG